MDAEGRVAVERRRVEVDGTDHSGARLGVLVVVVDRRVVVGLVVHAVDADGVGDLHRRVHVEVGGIRDHASEQRDVDRVEGVRDLLHPGFVVLGLQEPRDVGRALDGEPGQSVELARAEEDEVLGLGQRLLGLFAAFGVVGLRLLRALALGNLDLEPGGHDDICRQLQGFVLGDGRVVLTDAAGQHLDDLLGPHTQLARVEEVLGLEVVPGGLLPCLAGDPGSGDSPVHRRLGGTGVVPVQIARWNGLQGMDIEVETVHEASLSCWLMCGCCRFGGTPLVRTGLGGTLGCHSPTGPSSPGSSPSVGSPTCRAWKDRPHSLRTRSGPSGHCQV